MLDHAQQNRNAPDRSFVDLEIRIRSRQDEGYPVEVTLDSQQEFQRGYLTADVLSLTSGQDGQRLFKALFVADDVLRSAWDKCSQVPQRRIRLRIDADAAKLHELPWELLQEDSIMLSAQADTPFSRYLPDERPRGTPVPVQEYPIRVLVVISDPGDLEVKYNLPRVNVAQERENLEAIFGTVAPSRLRADLLAPPVTLERLEEKLRAGGGYHILHYLGHSKFDARRGQAVLYMQDEEGITQFISDDKLAQLLEHLHIKPHLVFLAACQSAIHSTGDAFLGMAPKLVSAGIPAVVAMRGRVTVESARKFGSTFYQCLLEHGLVDLAVNQARKTLWTAGRPDIGAPVLFMRLIHGRLWKTAEVGDMPTPIILGKLPELPSRGELPLPADVPMGSRLPFQRNPWFTGRVEQLNNAAQALFYDQSDAVVTQVTQFGMGGIGKTQLAIELAYRYGRYLRGIHWLDATNPDRIDEEIAACGEEMNLPNWPEKVSEQVKYTLWAWKRSGPRLVILDNIENPEAIRKWLTGDKLRSRQLRLLLITRWTRWPDGMGLAILPLDVFAPDESFDFLRHHLPASRATDDDLRSLAIRLGHLPLALELAARYLKTVISSTVTVYINQLDTKTALDHLSMQNWHPTQRTFTNHDLNLMTTFNLSWDQVKSQKYGEASCYLFLMAGRCALNSPIPYEFLQGALREAASSVGITEEIFDEALFNLTNLSLLQEEHDGRITIHLLLAEYAHTLWAKEQDHLRIVLAKALVKALARLTCQANQSNVPARFVPLRPHVGPIAEMADEDGLEEAGTLWNNLGYYLWTVADYAGARDAFERAIRAILTKLWGG